MIEFLTAVWGGKYSLIVPTDGNKILPVFWQLLEAFDPDYLYFYRRTCLDVKLSRPGEFAKTLQRELDNWMASNPGDDRAAAEKRLEEVLYQAPCSNQGISQELQHELKLRLSPFTQGQYAVGPGGITGAAAPLWPLTAVADLLPYCDHPGKVSMAIAETQDVPTVWVAAVSGRVNQSYARALKDLGIAAFDQTIPEGRLWDLFEWVVTGQPDRLRREIARLMGSEDLAPEVPLIPFPFDLSMVNAAFYSRRRFDEHTDPVAVVVGDSLSDFCLYYGLHRVCQRVAWLPQKWLESFSSAGGGPQAKQFIQMFAANVYRLTDDGQRQYYLHSISCSPLDLKGASEALGRSCAQLSDLAFIPPGIDRCLISPRRVYNNGRVQRDSLRYFVRHETPGPIETPKPEGFRRIDPTKHRWISEVSVQGHTFPRIHGIAQEVVRATSSSEYLARCTSEGLAYFCPNWTVSSDDIDAVLVRPIIRVPPVIETFQFLLRRAGFEHLSSDKGRFTRDSVRRFRGLEAFAKFARDSKSRAVLDRYVKKKRNEPGDHDDGVYLQEEQRTFLDLAAIERILGDPEGGSRFVDALVSRGVLTRGLILKCQFCLNAAWFSPREVDRTFKCTRCRRTQIMTRAHWREPAEPKWYYKLDEIVYQGWLNNMDVPVLALDALRRSCKASFEYCEEQSLYQDGEPLKEVDILCICDGIVTIGEAKAADRIEDSAKEEGKIIRRYRHIAEAIGCGQVVFATMADRWRDGTVEAIQNAFADSRVVLSLLKSSELLHLVKTDN